MDLREIAKIFLQERKDRGGKVEPERGNDKYFTLK